MKHPFSPVAALALLLTSLASAAASDAASSSPVFTQLESGKPQTVVVYGTSLTHGGAWAQAARQWLDEHYPNQVTFINSAVPGQNSDWGLANLEGKVLAHRPDLVFIEFSYNDAHDKFHMPVERGAANLKAMIETLRAENPEVVIVLQTMNVGWDAPNGSRSSSVRPQLDAFNDNYRNVARALGLPLLDHYPAWKKLKDTEPQRFQKYVPDGSHPTDKASLAITWPTVKAWLEAEGPVTKSPAANPSQSRTALHTGR